MGRQLPVGASMVRIRGLRRLLTPSATFRSLVNGQSEMTQRTLGLDLALLALATIWRAQNQALDVIA